MSKIKKITAKKIFDSRGKETIEAQLVTDNGILVSSSVPSGTSSGTFEAKVVEIDAAISNINNIISPQIMGISPEEQEKIDNLLIDLDGTEKKEKLGANAILATSIAVARAGAEENKQPLFYYLNLKYSEITGEKIEIFLPTPMMVMISGGLHGKGKLHFQEFLVLTSLENGQKIYKALEQYLIKNNLECSLGLEGGFALSISDDKQALSILLDVINGLGLKINQDVRLGIDFAANNCQISSNNVLDLINEFPIYSLEDPLRENDWENWQKLKSSLDNLHKEYLLIGDDLFVTNIERINHGIEKQCANTIIIKPNQIGTLTETLKAIATAKNANMSHIVSHRSGETMDSFIVDLACATGAKYLKAGAPKPIERMAKYNRLNEIKEII